MRQRGRARGARRVDRRHRSRRWSRAREAGIVFMFAPLMHPAMRHVGPVRRELGVPTVMNIVGPLANPAHAGRQVVGVADARRLARSSPARWPNLGTVHALVVHGAGMDEISPLGPTQVVEIRGRCADANGRSIRAALGFGGGDRRPKSRADRRPRTPRPSCDVLRGEANAPSTAAVVLNAAAAIYVGGRRRRLRRRRGCGARAAIKRGWASSRSIGCGARSHRPRRRRFDRPQRDGAQYRRSTPTTIPWIAMSFSCT